MNTSTFRNVTLMLSLTAALALFGGCKHCITGEGDMNSVNLEPGAFSSLKIKIPAKVVIEQGLTPQFKVEAQANIINTIKLSTSKEVLLIDSKECIGQNKGIAIYITNPVYNKLFIDGQGSISGKGLINTGQLELVITGNGQIKLNANAGTVFCGIRGNGEVDIEGSAQKEFVKIDGNGSFKASNLPAVDADLQLNGSGKIEIFSLQTLHAQIDGSGSIRYKGNPKVTTKINGSGNVSRLE